MGAERSHRGAGVHPTAGGVPRAARLQPGGLLQQDVRHHSATTGRASHTTTQPETKFKQKLCVDKQYILLSFLCFAWRKLGR